MKTQSLLPINEQNASVTMSSREIAELCEKRHELVLRDIAILNEAYQKGGYPIILETTYKHPQNGQVYKHCLLTQEQVLDLVTGYKHEIRIKINRRWQELEAQQVVHLPQNFAEALRLAADLEEEKQALLIGNQQQSTQIASMESYFRNGISPFEFVKGLNGVNALKTGEFLMDKNWLYQDGHHKRVRSYARDQYLTEETTEIAQHGKDAFVAYKPVLLRKGAAKLYEWYTKGELPMKKNWNGEFTQDKAVGL